MVRNIIKSLLLHANGKNLGTYAYQRGFKDWFKSPEIDVTCVLVGFPRTGTHWIRNVTQKVSGFYCPSLQHDECDINKVKAQKKIPLLKVHARSPMVAKLKLLLFFPPHRHSGKYIYTYRDPRDAIISLYEMYKILKNYPNLTTKIKYFRKYCHFIAL